MKSSLLTVGRLTENTDYLSAPLTIPEWDKIQDLPKSQDVPEGADLYTAGAPSRNIYLIRRGVVKLKCVGLNGRGMIVGIRSSGWMLGADAAILSAPHACTAVAMTPCQVSAYSNAEFLTGLRECGSLTHHVHTVLSYGMRAYLAAQVELRSESAQQRLEHFLRDLQEMVEVVGQPRPELSQVEMAQVLSITPEHLCRIMGKKRKDRPRIAGQN